MPVSLYVARFNPRIIGGFPDLIFRPFPMSRITIHQLLWWIQCKGLAAVAGLQHAIR